MTRTRSQIGRDNQQLGENLESWLNEQHSLAAEKGILAHVEKTQAKSKIVHGKLIFEKPGIADYVGCLEGYSQNVSTAVGVLVPARYLAVEAKSTDDVRLPKSRVEPKQQEHLTAVALAGGLSLLVVEFRQTVPSVDSFTLSRRYAVPWLEIPWVTLRTAESVLEENITQWSVWPGTCYLSRWHAGGPRSGVHSVGSQRHKVYPRE